MRILSEGAQRIKMATWADVEELVAHWLRAASFDSWFELAGIETEQEELGRCMCGSCQKVSWAIGRELREMWCDVVLELLPLLRLEAASRSTRALKLRG